jgi:hypothetical protein
MNYSSPCNALYAGIAFQNENYSSADFTGMYANRLRSKSDRHKIGVIKFYLHEMNRIPDGNAGLQPRIK